MKTNNNKTVVKVKDLTPIDGELNVYGNHEYLNVNGFNYSYQDFKNWNLKRGVKEGDYVAGDALRFVNAMVKQQKIKAVDFSKITNRLMLKTALEGFKVLHLTLKKLPFDLMKDGFKQIEIRTPSSWMKSRLIKNLEFVEYDFIIFTNGYGTNSPLFVSEFGGVEISKLQEFRKYSNQIQFGINNTFYYPVNVGDYLIGLGPVRFKYNNPTL